MEESQEEKNHEYGEENTGQNQGERFAYADAPVAVVILGIWFQILHGWKLIRHVLRVEGIWQDR